jgi:hypothetical protein
VNDSRDNLSTADLAGQTAAQPSERTQQDAYDGPDRSADQPDSSRPGTGPDDSAGPVGIDGDMTGSARDAAPDDPDQRSAAGSYAEDTGVEPDGERRDDAGPVRTDVPPAASSTVDTLGAGSTVESSTGPLLGSADSEGFRARWTGVQTGFVDAPREAVQKADALVAELMQHLAATFADERGKLEQQWDRGDDVPTDDLRDAFQRYRSFFERLLST